MVREKCLLVSLAVAALVGQAWADYEGDVEERWFRNCLLFEMDGRIWVNHRMVYLQMGIAAGTPTRLSDDWAKRLKPLVSDIAADSKTRATTVLPGYGIPELSDDKSGLFLFCMKAKMRPFFSDRRAEYFEIIEARIVAVEVISAQWVRAWEQLQQSLDDVISVSMTAPSDDKRRLLNEAIDRGRLAVQAMISERVSEAAQTQVRQACPEAWLVGQFQKHSACEWGGWLERLAERLGMGAGSTMGTYCERWPVYDLLAESNSPTDFAAQIEKSEPGRIETALYRSSALGQVCMRDIGKLNPEQFEKLRKEARESLAGRRQRGEQIEQLPDSTQTKTIEEYGLVLRPANAKELARALVPSGTVVEKVSGGQKDVGLIPGDIVIDYARIYDLVVGRYYSYQKDWVANKIRYGQRLWVIRGDKIIELSGKGKE